MPATPHLDPSVVLWSTPESERAGRPLLVLLHGYGADERDLFGLVPMLPESFVMAAVRAPLDPPWPTPGYSWYPIEGLEGRGAQAHDDAAKALLEWVDAQSGFTSVGLFGFSQGAATSLQALRLEPTRFAFAVALSGYAHPDPVPSDHALKEQQVPVFWGRGDMDDVIPPMLIEHTTAWLPSQVDLTGRVYPNLGHAISPNELDDIGEFLDRQHARLDA